MKEIIDYNEDSDTKWFSIGKVAEHFDITVSRLRGWCDQGIVENSKDTRGRKIPSTEFNKIEKIISIFEQKGPTTTIDEVKQELKKNQLFSNHVADTERKERVKDIAEALQATGMAEVFFKINEKLDNMNSSMKLLSSEPQVSITPEAIKEMNLEQVEVIKKMLFQNPQVSVTAEEVKEINNDQILEIGKLFQEQIQSLKEQLKEEKDSRKRAEERSLKLEENMDKSLQVNKELNEKLNQTVELLLAAEKRNEELLTTINEMSAWQLLFGKKKNK